MKYLVVVLLVAACVTAATAAAASCALSEQFFARHNISAHDSDNEPGAFTKQRCIINIML